MRFLVCKACMKSTRCVLPGDCQGGIISVHEPAKGEVIVVILGYGDFIRGRQFMIPVMILGS